jgi:tyrosinase
MSMHIRKNVKNLTADEKTKFVNAILTLKTTRPSVLHQGDPTMNRYDDYVEIHMMAMMAGSQDDPRNNPNWQPGWAHNGPAFFPWHRVLLLQFEKDLQAIDSTITIPYWDWPDNASSPFTLDFLGPDGDRNDPQDPLKVNEGPFAYDGSNHWTINVNDPPDEPGAPALPNYLRRGLGRRADAQNLPSAVQIKRTMSGVIYDSPPWMLSSPGFRSTVEIAIHNLVHRWVNGTMMLMTSPNDPVFWLHHCNIDRLWGDWQQQHPDMCPYQPSGASLARGHNLLESMIFNMDPPSPWPDSYTPANVLDHHSLGYSYESDPPLPTTIAVETTTVAAEQEQRRRIVASQTGQIKRVVPLFPLMKEIRALSPRLRSKRKMYKSIGSKKKKKAKRRRSSSR